MQVVDDQEQRSRGGPRNEEARDGILEPEARLLSARTDRRIESLHARVELGHQPCELTRTITELSPQLRVGLGRHYSAAQDLQPRPVRRRAFAFVAATDECLEARARSANSSVSRVLPIPGSPTTRAIPPSPPDARSNVETRRAMASVLPTKSEFNAESETESETERIGASRVRPLEGVRVGPGGVASSCSEWGRTGAMRR